MQFKPLVSGSNTASLNIPSSGLTSPSLSGSGTPIWVAETLPSGTPKLSGVWATDPQNVYAVGNAGTILYRGSGGTWSAQSLTGSPPDLTAVSGSSSTKILTVGGNDIYQSTGTGTWTSQTSDGPYTGVWAFSSADIWATWDTVVADPNTGNAVYRYTPALGWRLAADAADNPLHGSSSVWGSSASDVFIYGGYYRFDIPTNSFVTAGNIFHRRRGGELHDAIQPGSSDRAVQIVDGGTLALGQRRAGQQPVRGHEHVSERDRGADCVCTRPVTARGTRCRARRRPCSATPSGATTRATSSSAAPTVSTSTTAAAWSSSLASTSHFFGISGSNTTSPNIFAVGVASDGTTGVIQHYY